jgi:hypothetical protein
MTGFSWFWSEREHRFEPVQHTRNHAGGQWLATGAIVGAATGSPENSKLRYFIVYIDLLIFY